MLSTLLDGNLCLANFTASATITPEETRETVDETPVNVVQQSVPDENSGDEIVMA